MEPHHTRINGTSPARIAATGGSLYLGLRYDSTCDDYKILKIHHKVCSEILALKSGPWRKIDNHPIGIYPILSGKHFIGLVRH